jgi:hypothetical protein
MIAARYASLLAFAQSRGSDCGREPDGKFGGGNKCAVVGGVLRPKSAEPHEQEPSFSDKDDDHVYHVTTQVNAASILSEGFKQSGSTVKGGAYETYSKGKLFFTEKSGLATWKGKIEDHLFHEHDDPPPVAIVRVKKSEVEHLLKPDEIGTKDAGSKAYYVDLTGKKKEGRAFCATGVGGGVKNDCSSSDGGQSAKSFPKGSQNLRDAVDSVAPNPEQVWDRSRGLAETPAPKEMDDIANEQTSYSGASLTPEAEASYGSLVDEIGRQYEALTAAGLKARAWRGEGEPYGDPPGSTKPNSNKMREEVAKTGEFSFYMTDKGFGTGDATPNHPMLRETKYKTADGEPMIANDLFRVVHDMVAHVRGGYSFSTNGEYNGMLTHASTLPEAAWPALFAETFGQNAVYEKTKNYAPQNAYASKVGPEIIRSELKKRNKSSRAAKDDGDEPLGYQHLKSRPALLKSLVEERAFCATGEGNGIDNSCGAKTMQAPDKDGGGGSPAASSVVFSSSTTAKLRDGDTIDASDEDADENVAAINWQAAEDIGRSNPELQQAVYKYSAGPHEVNGYFRYGESLDEYAENIGSTPEKLAASASATESAITTIAAAANPDGRELTSFRGLMNRRQNREYIEAIKSVSVGDVIKEAGVFSTSASLRRASMAFTSQDEGVIFRVKGRGGAPIAHVANYRDEWEVAYPNRSKFVVTSVARNVSVRISDSHRLTNVTFIDIREAD